MAEKVQKLIPRNASALRKLGASSPTRLVPGNPVSTRLESAIGNCFPGLELDLRNLERRFFPFLVIDFRGVARVASVDLAGAEAAFATGLIDLPTRTSYRTIANDIRLNNGRWRITNVTGDFVGLGDGLEVDFLALPPTSEGSDRLPTSAWTAIRLLVEDSLVTLRIARDNGTEPQTIRGKRLRYFGPTGSLNAVFAVGEMSQSLCSPWTHDFRDCGCHYWASNHPDITLPPRPATNPTNAAWSRRVQWQRSDLQVRADPPLAATIFGEGGATDVLEYHAINQRWTQLNYVLEGRERLTEYTPTINAAQPFASLDEAAKVLRYLAGVELAVIHEYLAGAFSLRRTRGSLPANDWDNVRAARAEIMRIAFSEMRHLRLVNDVLRQLHTGPTPFVPALGIARVLPTPTGGTRPVEQRPLTLATLDSFIEIEAASSGGEGIDGQYGRILKTLEQLGTAAQVAAAGQIVAEGADHHDTFRFVREWLVPVGEANYLLQNLQAPDPNSTVFKNVQTAYASILVGLFNGYAVSASAGNTLVDNARGLMLGATGLAGLCDAVAAAGQIVAFDAGADPRFAPVDPP